MDKYLLDKAIELANIHLKFNATIFSIDDAFDSDPIMESELMDLVSDYYYKLQEFNAHL